MNYRTLGKTGYKISDISFGAWAIGGTWGEVNDSDSLAALHAAVDAGVNFIDTADVYGDGRSERLIAQLLKDRSENITVATKAGRRLDPHVPEGFNRKQIEAFIDRSLKNLDVDCLDLLQLHCPPPEVYYQPEVFDMLDEIKRAGKIRHYGVSVEKIEEALKAIEYDGVATVQLIFNAFRQRPTELFFEQAMKRNVGILARVPMASGLLTGKLTASSTFSDDDHRKFNRQGEAFDKGETFSGVDFEEGLKAVEELRVLVPEGTTMAQFALRWILMHEAVSCAIPGAKTPAQASDNAAASDLPEFSDDTMAAVRATYDKYIYPLAHHRW
jgi:aryl-alcohol dehydrogenase-like predicted oxidoreductase